jgi:hypothetical protein
VLAIEGAAGAFHLEAAGRSRLSALAAVVFNVASSRCRLPDHGFWCATL